MISSFRREVDENCAVMGHYTASSGNFLQTFRVNLYIINYHSTLRNNPDECSSQEAKFWLDVMYRIFRDTFSARIPLTMMEKIFIIYEFKQYVCLPM